MNTSRLVLALIGATAACSGNASPQTKNPRDTADLATGEVTFDISAQSYDDGHVSAYATPHYDVATLPLGGGDVLAASIGNGPVTYMNQDSSNLASATLPLGSLPADVTVVFRRSGNEARSVVTIPAPPRIVNAPAELTQGDDLVLTLDSPPPAGAKVRLRFDDADVLAKLHWDELPLCLPMTKGKNVIDPTKVDGARITVSSAALFARVEDMGGTPPEHACTAVVGVRFETQGTPSPALGKGTTASGLSERSVTIHVTRTDA